jgi:hypothetical protein
MILISVAAPSRSERAVLTHFRYDDGELILLYKARNIMKRSFCKTNSVKVFSFSKLALELFVIFSILIK